MGVLARDKTYLAISTSQIRILERILGYIIDMELQIDTINISKDNLGDTAWTEILELLGVDFDEILSLNHSEVPEKFKGCSFDTKGWLKILIQNPIMLENQIAINGNKAKQIEYRDDILKFYGVD